MDLDELRERVSAMATEAERTGRTARSLPEMTTLTGRMEALLDVLELLALVEE
jgi:hypothetical protein